MYIMIYIHMHTGLQLFLLESFTFLEMWKLLIFLQEEVPHFKTSPARNESRTQT